MGLLHEFDINVKSFVHQNGKGKADAGGGLELEGRQKKETGRIPGPCY
jgi:hypothetical protein